MSNIDHVYHAKLYVVVAKAYHSVILYEPTLSVIIINTRNNLSLSLYFNWFIHATRKYI